MYFLTVIHFESQNRADLSDIILQQHVWIFREERGANFLLWMTMPVLTVQPSKSQVLDKEDVTNLEWPSFSPDLNPIVHAWDARLMRCRTSFTCYLYSRTSHRINSGVIWPNSGPVCVWHYQMLYWQASSTYQTYSLLTCIQTYTRYVFCICFMEKFSYFWVLYYLYRNFCSVHFSI